MTVITNTTDTFSIKGIREELSNVIYNISPEDTPFMSNAGRESVENTLYEWQRDVLAAAVSTNAQIQGDDVTSFDAVTATVRMGNRTQISRKALVVADTVEAVSKAGRKAELAYQIAKRSAEIKRDIEKNSLDRVAAVAGATNTAPKTGTMGATIGSIDGTNVSMGAGGANPTDATTFTNARTDGTQRAFTEALLKTVLSGVWTNGGSPDTIMLGPTQKAVASAFAGIATKTYFQEAARPAAIIGAADVYVGEFGTYSIVPNRFQRDRDAWVLDFEYVAIVYLRPFQVKDLAKTGDAEKKLLLAEWGLKVYTDFAHGMVADLT
jgi:Family of unknown function (DUF5309)